MKPPWLGLIMFIVFSKAYAESIPSYDFNTGQLHLPQVKVLSSTGETIGLFEAYLETVRQDPIDFTVKSATAIEADETFNNEQIARRFVREVLSEGQMEVIDEIFAPEAVVHLMDSLTSTPEIYGLAAIKQSINSFHELFSDLQITIDDSFVDGDKVTIRWTAIGTHTGALPDLPASQAPITTSGIYIFRVTAGQIIELWRTTDALGIMKQLGAIPESVPTF
jgi:predicted ester cyclase